MGAAQATRIQLEKGLLSSKLLKEKVKLFRSMREKLKRKKMPREGETANRVVSYMLDLISEKKNAMKIKHSPELAAKKVKKLAAQVTADSRKRKRLENEAAIHAKKEKAIKAEAMAHMHSETCKHPNPAAAPAPSYVGLLAQRFKGKKKGG